MNHDSIFSQFLISESVRPYEYTKRNAIQMKNLLAGLDDEEIETTDVYRFLKNLEPIPLHLYLKRWLYQNCNMQGDFESIDNHSYYQVIRQSFYYKNQTPFSWEKTAKKPNAIIISWLERGSVRRKTIFLLGFGLGMTEDEVSDFLVKAIGEEDFDLRNPEEIIFWHCYHTGKNFEKMRELLANYQQGNAGKRKKTGSVSYMRTIAANPKQYLFSEDTLLEYLNWIGREQKNFESQAYNSYMELYQDLGKLLGDSGGRHTAGLIEKHFCSSTPRDKSGNLVRFSDSMLTNSFRNYRVSRQRIESICDRQIAVSRQDLITLVFFQECLENRRRTSSVKCILDHMNELLDQCHMAPVYLGSPYEIFLIICLCTDTPLDLYLDIMELSYNVKEGTI